MDTYFVTLGHVTLFLCVSCYFLLCFLHLKTTATCFVQGRTFASQPRWKLWECPRIFMGFIFSLGLSWNSPAREVRWVLFQHP